MGGLETGHCDGEKGEWTSKSGREEGREKSSILSSHSHVSWVVPLLGHERKGQKAEDKMPSQ